jgi:hypothetical protein
MILTAAVQDVADTLLRYHEDETARWIEISTDEEYIDVCNVAAFLLSYGPQGRTGYSMMIDKALAIAAVYIHEGSPRGLRRVNRDNKRVLPSRPPIGELEKRRNNSRLPTYGTDSGIGDDFVKFWARSPEVAKEYRARPGQINPHLAS